MEYMKTAVKNGTAPVKLFAAMLTLIMYSIILEINVAEKLKHWLLSKETSY